MLLEFFASWVATTMAGEKKRSSISRLNQSCQMAEPNAVASADLAVAAASAPVAAAAAPALNDLPAELLVLIAWQLEISSEVASAAASCRALRAALRGSRDLWGRLALQHFVALAPPAGVDVPRNAAEGRADALRLGGVPACRPLAPGDDGTDAFEALAAARARFRQCVHVVQGDMARLQFDVDALAVPSNYELEDPGFGACHAVCIAAGPALQGHIRESLERILGQLQARGAVSTPPFGLGERCKHLLHCVGPNWPYWELGAIGRLQRAQEFRTLQGGSGFVEDAEQARELGRARELARGVKAEVVRALCKCYEDCFDEFERLGARTVAFPGISTGARGFPALLAAAIAMESCRARLESGKFCPERITFVCYQDASDIFAPFLRAQLSVSANVAMVLPPRPEVTAEVYQAAADSADEGDDKSAALRREVARLLVSEPAEQ